MKPLDVLREEWRVLAKQWSTLHARAERYDEGRKILLDEITLRFVNDLKMPVGRAEKEARTSKQFREYLASMYDAKRAAQDARIDARHAELVYMEQVADEATRRAEMRLTHA